MGMIGQRKVLLKTPCWGPSMFLMSKYDIKSIFGGLPTQRVPRHGIWKERLPKQLGFSIDISSDWGLFTGWRTGSPKEFWCFPSIHCWAGRFCWMIRYHFGNQTCKRHGSTSTFLVATRFEAYRNAIWMNRKYLQYLYQQFVIALKIIPVYTYSSQAPHDTTRDFLIVSE